VRDTRRGLVSAMCFMKLTSADPPLDRLARLWQVWQHWRIEDEFSMGKFKDSHELLGNKPFFLARRQNVCGHVRIHDICVHVIAT
jgi:hypothetical protein